MENIILLVIFTPLRIFLTTFIITLVLLLFSPPDVEKPMAQDIKYSKVHTIFTLIFGLLCVVFAVWSIFYYIKI